MKAAKRIGAVVAFVLVAAGAWFSALALTGVVFLIDRFEADRIERDREEW